LSQEWGYYETPAELQPVAISFKEHWTPPAFLRSRSLRMVGKVVWAVVA